MLMKDFTPSCEKGCLPAILECLILWESVKVTQNGFWVLALSVELSVTEEPVLHLLGINIDNKGLITPLTFPCDNENKPGVHPLDSLCLLDTHYTSMCSCSASADWVCGLHWMAVIQLCCFFYQFIKAYMFSCSQILSHDYLHSLQ